MIKKIEHVALIVKDMDQSLDFYTTVFGYKLRFRGENPRRELAFLYHDNQPGMEIELIRDLVPADTYATQGIVNHLAFTVDDVQAVMESLAGKGISFHTSEPITAPDGAKVVFFYGPNQELLQLVQPASA
jgi:lactoylglutathione lyase